MGYQRSRAIPSTSINGVGTTIAADSTIDRGCSRRTCATQQPRNRRCRSSSANRGSTSEVETSARSASQSRSRRRTNGLSRSTSTNGLSRSSAHSRMESTSKTKGIRRNLTVNDALCGTAPALKSCLKRNTTDPALNRLRLGGKKLSVASLGIATIASHVKTDGVKSPMLIQSVRGNATFNKKKIPLGGKKLSVASLGIATIASHVKTGGVKSPMLIQSVRGNATFNKKKIPKRQVSFDLLSDSEDESAFSRPKSRPSVEEALQRMKGLQTKFRQSCCQNKKEVFISFDDSSRQQQY